MNWKRWLLVGYLLALMAFTTSVLLIPREKYNTLTTSDSGFFFGVAREINENNGMVENYSLSHAPYGLPIGIADQGQPLITVMLYRAVSTLNPSIELMDVARYWGPLLFALSLIPIFLIGRALGGDFGGCAAAFFGATLTSSIYWHKVGAFDREPLMLILAAWTIFLTMRMLKGPRSSIPQFALLAGLVYGIFGLSWGGWWYIVPILIGGMILVLLVRYIEKLVRKSADFVTADLLVIRENLHIIAGVLGILAVLTFVVCTLGGQSPMLWEGIARSLLGFAGARVAWIVLIVLAAWVIYLTIRMFEAPHSSIPKSALLVRSVYWIILISGIIFVHYAGTGIGEGVSFARYAGEMAPPGSWDEIIYKQYGAGDAAILTTFVFALVALALIKFCWSRKRWELIAFPWLVVLAGLVWPGMGQIRFERQWWPLVPVLAGVGAAVLVSLIRRVSFEQFGEWLKHFQRPVVIAFSIGLVATPFIFNAYAVAGRTTPPTEWHGYGLDAELMDSFAWLRENTPENSIVAIEWSFGHVLTGTSNRATVADGTETMGELGKWENTATIRPPDYVYYVQDSTGIFLNSHWTINGRRTDVQYLPTLTDDNELAFYFKTYRDNYEVRIDYVIFHRYLYNTAIWATRRGGVQDNISASIQDEKIFYTFRDENVVFDPQRWEAYVQRGGENLYLAGVVIYDINRGQVVGYNLRPDPSIPRVVWVFVSDWNPLWAQLTAPDVHGLPVLMRVFEGRGTMPDFMEIAHTSSNGLVKVIKINHVPALISPVDSISTNDDTPTFQWSGAVGAVKYELWVDNNADFSSPEIRENVFATMYTPTPTSELADGTYSWRVMAFRADNTEFGWSPTWTFVVDTLAPEGPQLREPENGATTSDNTQTFGWTLGAGATKHRLLVDNDGDFSTPEVDVTLSVPENTHTSSELVVGSYWWKVIAIDGTNNENESSVWTFTVQA